LIHRLCRPQPAGRIAYVNGRYLRHYEAGVHVEDRGLQFGDAVYEVCRVETGRMHDVDEHLDRLERSLRELEIPMPMARAALEFTMGEVVRRNRIGYGLIYLQVTRGTMRRDFPIPDPPILPTLILTAHEMNPAAVNLRRQTGIAVVTRPDERWGRCDIKTTQLLASLRAKTFARRQGAFEAWLVDAEGFVTEGASCNAWIVDADGVVVTRSLSHALLPGVTRQVILTAAAKAALPVAERRFTPAEAAQAREAFVTSSTGPAIPVVAIDAKQIGDGKPGPLTQKIAEIYFQYSANLTE
jgi:D-alanine transaminase